MKTINVKLKAKWQFKGLNYIVVTECKRVVNIRTGNILKYNVRGYYIKGRYYKKYELKNHLEVIKLTECQF